MSSWVPWALSPIARTLIARVNRPRRDGSNAAPAPASSSPWSGVAARLAQTTNASRSVASRDDWEFALWEPSADSTRAVRTRMAAGRSTSASVREGWVAPPYAPASSEVSVLQPLEESDRLRHTHERLGRLVLDVVVLEAVLLGRGEQRRPRHLPLARRCLLLLGEQPGERAARQPGLEILDVHELEAAGVLPDQRDR